MDVNKTKTKKKNKTKLSAVEVYLLEDALRMVFIQIIIEERVT